MYVLGDNQRNVIAYSGIQYPDDPYLRGGGG